MILTEFFAREADLYEKEFIWTGTGNILSNTGKDKRTWKDRICG